MPKLQVQNVLNNPKSTIPDLLEAHEEMCIQYGYLFATKAHNIRQNAEADLTEIFCLMSLIKERINNLSKPIN